MTLLLVGIVAGSVLGSAVTAAVIFGVAHLHRRRQSRLVESGRLAIRLETAKRTRILFKQPMGRLGVFNG